MAFRDVTSACDDDARVDMGFWDVTLAWVLGVVTSAYDDDARGNIDSRDVTSAYDDDAKGILPLGM